MNLYDETTKIWKGPAVPSIYPSDLHMSEIILKILKKTPNRVLQIYDENGAQMTCEELRLKATRVAQNLTDLGIKRGDVIGFNCSNSEHICALIHGCIFIGAIPSPMTLAHDKNDLIHMWSQTEPKFIFCDAEVYMKVVEALKDMKNNATVCTLVERKDGIMFVDDVLATTEIKETFEPVTCEGSEEKLICILSSSGTSGPQKAVCLSQSLILQFDAFHQLVEGRFIHFGPIFWAPSFKLFAILPLINGIRIVTRRLASVENYLEFVEKFKVNFLFAAPTILNKTLQSPLIETANLSSLKTVLAPGATLQPYLRIKFKEMFPGKQLMSLYGSTEIDLIAPSLCDENEGYTVGRPLPNSELKIIDDSGNKLGINERGEICGKLNFSLLGYYKNPEASKNAIDDDNFFRTGDIGYFNGDGLLNVVDRKKDIFKNPLYQINPAEIENVIQSLDGVELVSVVGIRNEVDVNAACAVVIKCEGYDHLTKDDVIDYVATRLPEYKQLHGGAIFVEKFPTTSTGKIIKRLITEFAQEEFMKLKLEGHNGQHKNFDSKLLFMFH